MFLSFFINFYRFSFYKFLFREFFCLDGSGCQVSIQLFIQIFFGNRFFVVFFSGWTFTSFCCTTFTSFFEQNLLFRAWSFGFTNWFFTNLPFFNLLFFYWTELFLLSSRFINKLFRCLHF